MDLVQIFGFAIVAALLVMSPGPNGVLIAKTTPTSGKAVAFANIGGFVAAFFVHGTLSIFGISIILVQSAQLFFAVKMVGAAYLVWLGLKALYEAWKGVKDVAVIAPARRNRTFAAAVSEGFLTNAFNPKVTMFYLAAFPQFIPEGQAAISSAFFLVTIHVLINVIWFSAMIFLFSRLTAAAQSGAFQRWLKAVTGVVFLSFGAKLATLER